MYTAILEQSSVFANRIAPFGPQEYLYRRRPDRLRLVSITIIV